MKSDLFRKMPPRRHDRVADRSGVLAYIDEVTGEGLDAAKRTFHYLRNRRHLIFNQRTRQWMGAEFVPIEDDQERAHRQQGEINDLRQRMARLEGLLDNLGDLVTRLREGHNSLAAEVANLDRPAEDDSRMTNG